jgi:hypothetical protein
MSTSQTTTTDTNNTLPILVVKADIPTTTPLPHPLRSHPVRPRHRLHLVHATARLSSHTLGPLVSGPAVYAYMPLAARTPELESLRYDHGVSYVRQASFRGTILQWCAEDAQPKHLKERVAAVLEPKRKGVFGRLKRWAGKKVARLCKG